MFHIFASWAIDAETKALNEVAHKPHNGNTGRKFTMIRCLHNRSVGSLPRCTLCGMLIVHVSTQVRIDWLIHKAWLVITRHFDWPLLSKYSRGGEQVFGESLWITSRLLYIS